MDYGCTRLLGIVKARLNLLVEKDIFTDLGDLEYLQRLESRYEETCYGLSDRGVIPGDPYTASLNHRQGAVEFLYEAQCIYLRYLGLFEKPSFEENSQTLESVQQSQPELPRLKRQLNADLDAIADNLRPENWQNDGHADEYLLAFESWVYPDWDESKRPPPLRDGQLALEGEAGSPASTAIQEFSSKPHNRLDSYQHKNLYELIHKQGILYRELNQQLHQRKVALEELVKLHAQDSDRLSQGLQLAEEGYFGSAYDPYTAISGTFRDVDYTPLQESLSGYERGLVELQKLELSLIHISIPSFNYWYCPPVAHLKTKKAKRTLASLQVGFDKTQLALDPWQTGHFGGAQGRVQKVSSKLENHNRALSRSAKSGLIMSWSVFGSCLLAVLAFVFFIDHLRIKGLRETYPDRKRFESDQEDAERITETNPESREPFNVASIGIQMRWCKPGTFVMGDEEEGQRLVMLTNGFYLSSHEVTQAQYVKVMGWNPSHFRGDDLPVEKVSWNDAVRFCESLTAMERTAGRLEDGWVYQLPTEAQWEYACRAGTRTTYSFGDTVTSQYANFNHIERRTTPVGRYKANAWGFHDMHGNLQEWCSDWYGSYPKGLLRNPMGASVGSLRVYRGGSWGSGAWILRSAYRYWNAPDNRNYILGFRLSSQIL